ncbi:DUF4136 domain-containing protein [Altererythrobacter salegens]|uniref:DUF4136 domain-containing protein n=1 Tax=Croceibacterium salegens TaxID=1737568 RepID=A0A6I4SRH2_9SPHN|nr:DUF4136 domain-containing protein [Croceibacterium salegens]MXO58571.1 DUF4136 domain-containing protein [Croceibacterium salegens]
MNLRFAANAAIALALAAALPGCATTPKPSFNSEAAPDAPLGSYRTYAWAFNGAPSGLASPFTFQRVRESLDANLRQAGYTQVAESDADMIVAFTLGARDRVDVTDWGPVAPYYPAYGRAYRYGWAYNYRDVDVRAVTEGSLAFDVFDGQTDHPVWHGIAKADIGSNGASEELIEAATSGLVSRFVEAAR